MNDDGRWDPADEQFLYSTILALGKSRYAARSDELGTRLAFEVGRRNRDGAAEARIGRRASPPTTELHATLIGRDGSAVGLGGEGEGMTVPAGEYRLGTLSFSFDDPAGGPRWSFIFSDNGGTRDHKWYGSERTARSRSTRSAKLVLETGVEEPGKIRFRRR